MSPFIISVYVHLLLFNLFGPFGFTWSIGKIVISDPPPATPCMCQVSITSASGRPTIPWLIASLVATESQRRVGVVVLGTGVSAETFRWVKVYHGLPGLDGWVAAWQDTLHAIAFILRRNRQTAPMGVGSSMLWMLLAGGACMTWLYLQTPRRAHSAKSVAWMHRTCSLGHVWVAFKSREDYRIKGTGAASNVSMYCIWIYTVYNLYLYYPRGRDVEMGSRKCRMHGCLLEDPGSPSPISPTSAQAPTTPVSPGFGSTTPVSPGFGSTVACWRIPLESPAWPFFFQICSGTHVLVQADDSAF